MYQGLTNLSGLNRNRSLLSWGGLQNIPFANVSHLVLNSKFDAIMVTGNITVSKRFIFPWGHCLEMKGYNELNDLKPFEVTFTDSKYEAYITDRELNLYYRIDEKTLEGDRMFAVKENDVAEVKYYQVSVAEQIQAKHENPFCENYPTSGFASLAECVTEREKSYFMPRLGCMPPWMSAFDQCNGTVLDTSHQVADYLDSHFSQIAALRNVLQGKQQIVHNTNWN